MRTTRTLYVVGRSAQARQRGTSGKIMQDRDRDFRNDNQDR